MIPPTSFQCIGVSRALGKGVSQRVAGCDLFASVINWQRKDKESGQNGDVTESLNADVMMMKPAENRM
jgi:hypothetical protein